MVKTKVIRVSQNLIDFADKNKLIPTETYSSVIERLLIIQGYTIKRFKRK